MDLLLKWGSMIIFAGKRRVGGDTAGNRAAPRPIFSAGAPPAGPKKYRQIGLARPTARVALSCRRDLATRKQWIRLQIGIDRHACTVALAHTTNANSSFYPKKTNTHGNRWH